MLSPNTAKVIISLLKMLYCFNLNRIQTPYPHHLTISDLITRTFLHITPCPVSNLLMSPLDMPSPLPIFPWLVYSNYLSLKVTKEPFNDHLSKEITAFLSLFFFLFSCIFLPLSTSLSTHFISVFRIFSHPTISI